MKIFFMRNVPNNIPWSLKVCPVTSETLFPRKTMNFSCFSCFLTTVGISIVNACSVVSLYRNAHFSEGEEPEVDSSSFTNTQAILTSNDIITIYAPRAFQRIISNPLIRHYVRPAVRLVRRGRFHAMSDIRICDSSYI